MKILNVHQAKADEYSKECKELAVLRWSLAHWFVILRLSLKKDFSKWLFDAVKRAKQ